jgi:hypothetical protein
MASTYAFSEWIEEVYGKSVCLFKLFLTSDSVAYILLARERKLRFFVIDAKLLVSNRECPFKRIMGSAQELPIEMAVELGFLPRTFFPDC